MTDNEGFEIDPDLETEEVANEVETEVEATPEPLENEGEKKQSRFGERIKELVDAKNEAKAEAEYWRNKANEKQTQDDQDYNLDDDIRATVRQELEAEQKRAQEIAAQSEFISHRDALSATLLDSGLDGAVKMVTDAHAPVSPAMIKASKGVPEIAKVYDYLGNNPIEAFQIAQMPEALAKDALSNISKKFVSAPISNAPPPVQGVKSTGTPKAGLRDDMPIDEWLKLRRAEL